MIDKKTQTNPTTKKNDPQKPPYPKQQKTPEQPKNPPKIKKPNTTNGTAYYQKSTLTAGLLVNPGFRKAFLALPKVYHF